MSDAKVCAMSVDLLHICRYACHVPDGIYGAEYALLHTSNLVLTFGALVDVQVPLYDATQLEMDAPAAAVAGEEAVAPDEPAQLLDVLQLGQKPLGMGIVRRSL